MNPPDPCFLDTNILVYAFTRQDKRKNRIAAELIDQDRPWWISWQVIQEFCSVALHNRNRPVEPETLDAMLDLVLAPRCRVFPSPGIWQEALRLHQQTQYRFYDSLIVAAALETGVPILYSEDLQHGRRFGSLTILNPFL